MYYSHKFLPDTDTEGGEALCIHQFGEGTYCGFGVNSQYHFPENNHEFVNQAGYGNCRYYFQALGVYCEFSKDDPIHKQTSDNNSYRKPIGTRFDLIPPMALRRLAAVYEEGAQIYGDGRYISQPMPHSNVVNHLINHLNLAQCRDGTEDHWAKVAWAAFTMMVYEQLNIGEENLSPYGVVPKRDK